MPKVSEMRESSFIKKEEVGDGVLVTITGCVQENTALKNEAPELKWCLTFKEFAKPLVLNSTNAQIMERIFNSDDTDDWIGKKCVLYTDPNVSFGGKVVGGIRVRAAKAQAKAVPPSKPEAELETGDDDVTF